MITNQILQKTIDGFSSITKVDFAVTDPEGAVLASTMSDASQYSTPTVDFARSHAESQVMDGSEFFKVYDDGNLEFILIARDDDEEKAASMGKVAAFQLTELTVAYKERFDRDNFIKNLLLDNLLLVDIYNRSKKLHIDVEALRVCIVIEIDDERKHGDELECVRVIFGSKSHDFVTAVDEQHIIVVKQLATNSYGQYLGDEELEPLMAYLNSRKAVMITHPHKPSAVNDKLIAAVPLASYEYLAETTRAILNMVAHDVLVRYSDLKVVVPHCGSFLPNALPRFKGLLPVMVKQGYMQPVDVDANIARLYFDLAGAATDDAIDMLLTITEPSHILYGSDYPYVAAPALIGAKKALEARLAKHGLDAQEIFMNNAARLFGADLPVREYGERIVRLAQIEVYPEWLEEYLGYAKEVGTVSMASEPGVIGLFSMQDKANPCKVYILEVYADREAYQAHLQTAHFKKDKEGTADMVKSLQLIDTNPMVAATLNKSAIR